MRPLTHCRTLFCACIYLLGTTKGIPSADAADTDVPLCLIVENNAHVPNDVLDGARRHVERIYRQAGIKIIWLQNSPSAEKPDLPKVPQLTVVIVPECISPLSCGDPTVTGTAIGCDGKGAWRAYVFWKRVLTMATIVKNAIPFPYPESLILGHAIAHESGHVLLPLGHAKSGLMVAQMDAMAIQAAIRGKLLFLPEQAARMQRILTGQ
jgi:hypothetical protein